MRKIFIIIYIVSLLFFLSSCKTNTYELRFTETEIILKQNEEIFLPLELINISYEELFFEYNRELVDINGNKVSANLHLGETTLFVSVKNNPQISISILIKVIELKEINSSVQEIYFPKNIIYKIPLELTNLSFSDLDFSFSVDGIIEVNGEYLIGHKTGQVELLIAYKEDHSICLRLEINVTDEESFYLTEDTIKITEGENANIPIIFINHSLEDTSFEVKNPDFVEINNLVITGKSIGKTEIIIRSLRYDIVCKLMVEVELKREINIDDFSLKINSEQTLNLDLKNIEYEDLSFELSNNNIEINNNLVRALKPGSVILKIIYRNDEKISATVTITVIGYSISEVEYWLSSLASKNYNPYEMLLNQTQINTYNQIITANYSLTKTTDILTESETITQNSLLMKIESYSNLNTYSVYNEFGIPIGQPDKTLIANNRNLNNIPSIVNVNYGLITNFCAVRSYPTTYYSRYSYQDMFQETALNVGEGVIIYHTSYDGNWFFVQAQNYYGWIEKLNVAVCTKQEMLNFLSATDFILVISDYVMIENVNIRMGQKFPIISESLNHYIINFPTRNNNGILNLQEIEIAKTTDYHRGYLEYTTANVLIQAFKLIGINYSWGDKNVLGRDCSSTQNAVYACFGFKMPRNTSNQRVIPGYSENVSGLNETKLKTLKPGSLIFTRSHVLMYIGENENGVPYVFHNTSSGSPSCRIQSFSSYSGDFIATLKLA